jgi:hypothetical protein
VKGEFLKYVKDFQTINERLCWLRGKRPLGSPRIRWEDNIEMYH